MKTHGKSKTKTYRVWANMRNRCHRPKHHNYKYYGALGIKVCTEWKNSFSRFLEDMGECKPGMTLERIDTKGDYDKTNCMWATVVEQQNNKSTTIHLTANGKTQSLANWARELGVSPARIRMRLRRGMNHYDALFLPKDSFVKGCRKHHKSNRRLTDDQVRYIRSSVLSTTALGEMFNLSESAIGRVKKKITYTDVSDL